MFLLGLPVLLRDGVEGWSGWLSSLRDNALSSLPQISVPDFLIAERVEWLFLLVGFGLLLAEIVPPMIRVGRRFKSRDENTKVTQHHPELPAAVIRQESRPNLILEKAVVQPERITTWSNLSTGVSITTSGTVMPPEVSRWSQRDRPSRVARMMIRNSPTEHSPTAVAKGITARLRFFNETGVLVCEVPDARWTHNPSQFFPADRSKQAHVDFGIGETRLLDIAFKYDDTTVPYALSDAAVGSSPWDRFENMLNGKRFEVVAELSGEWVKTELRAELLHVRNRDGEVGELRFNALPMPGPARISIQKTPSDLAGLYRQHTEAQADKLVADYLGKWMTIKGKVQDVRREGDGLIVQVHDPAMGGPVPSAWVHAHFPGSRVDQVSHFGKGDEVRPIHGRVVRASDSWVRLEDCEMETAPTSPSTKQAAPSGQVQEPTSQVARSTIGGFTSYGGSSGPSRRVRRKASDLASEIRRWADAWDNSLMPSVTDVEISMDFSRQFGSRLSELQPHLSLLISMTLQTGILFDMDTDKARQIAADLERFGRGLPL